MIPQFIFGGNTGVTAGELAKRRALAEAMLERSQASMPRNLGEGIGVLGEALAGRMAFNRIAKQEREGQGRASSGMSQLMAALYGGTAPAAEGPAAPAGGAPVAAPQGDTFANMQQAESGMNPEAVSPKGAIGLSQIMPSTARDPGYGLPNMFQLAASKGFELPDNSDQTLNQLLRDPELSTDFGRAYFDKMKARNGGSDLLAAASYNAGPGAVQKAGGVPNFPETQAYVKKLGLTGGGAPQQPAPQMAQAQPTAGGQPQQATPQDTLRGIATFMSSPDFGFLRPEQQQFVADAFKREMNRANPDPLTQLSLEEKRLQVAKLRNPQMDPSDAARLKLDQDKFDFEKTKKEPDWSKLSDGSLFNERTGEVKQVPNMPTADIKDVTTLRKEVQDTQQIKNYNQAAPMYRSMVETAPRNSRASDLNLVYGLGKIMDPTSVVREGEMVMVKNTASLPDWLQGAISSLNGGAALTPTTRTAILREAQSRMNAYRDETEALKGQYVGIAQRYNLNMDDIWQPLAKLPDYKPVNDGMQAPPSGIDPQIWGVMTPEERALWK